MNNAKGNRINQALWAMLVGMFYAGIALGAFALGALIHVIIVVFGETPPNWAWVVRPAALGVFITATVCAYIVETGRRRSEE